MSEKRSVRLFLPDGNDGTGFGTASHVKREDAKRESRLHNAQNTQVAQCIRYGAHLLWGR